MINRLSLLSILFLAGCGGTAAPPGPDGVPERIVSLAPNITETVFALGLEDRLVGATTSCTYPAEARSIARVGGFGQFNYEAIVALKPDLVILHGEYDAEKTRLANLGIPCLETGSYTVADILATIRAIGKACDAAEAAADLEQRLAEEMERLRYDGTGRPRVLIAFGGNADDDIGQIHAFGTACLHHELLELAGGENIITANRPYALLSKEAVLRLNPDLIIVLAPEIEDTDRESAAWSTLSGIAEGDNRRIHILTGDYTCIPGPRFIETLRDFSRIIGEAP